MEALPPLIRLNPLPGRFAAARLKIPRHCQGVSRGNDSDGGKVVFLLYLDGGAVWKKLHVIPSQCAHWRTPGWPLLPYGQFTFWESRKET